MTSWNKGISTAELQRQFGHKRYDAIWAMMHKVRKAMGNKDENGQLTDVFTGHYSYIFSIKGKD